MYMSTDIPDPTEIARLNDLFRSGLIFGGQTVLTRHVADLDESTLATLLGLVRVFDQFDPDNDPFGEHDFGSILLEGERFFWKIDYYDSDMSGGSPDPANPRVTRRVLTIMHSSEY